LHGLAQKPLIGRVVDDKYHSFQRYHVDQLIYLEGGACVLPGKAA
jgi:hypothetical protein